MKRIISALLTFAVVFTLAACGRPGEKPATQTTLPEPETTTAAQIAETETVPDKAFFQLSSLPDIGTHSSQTVADRWYDTYQDRLIPRNDYGTLVPFIGEIQNYEYEVKYEGEEDGPGNTFAYGLMTTDGKIVVDAVYRQIITETAPNGKTFYWMQTYDQADILGAKANRDEIKERGLFFLADVNGSSFLEIPPDYNYDFTRDNVVLIPSNYFQYAPIGTYDSVYVYNMSLELVNTLSITAMVGKYERNGEYYPYAKGDYLIFEGHPDELYFDLEGNRAAFNKKLVSCAEYFGNYTLLTFEDYNQMLIDPSGKDCTPADQSGMSVTQTSSDAEGVEDLLLVNTENGYQVYDTSLRPIGSPHYGKLNFIRLFGKLCYRFENSSEDPLLYYELETDEHLDWSKYTKLDMSVYAPAYERSFSTPKIYKNRFFFHSYSQKNDGDEYVTWYCELIDLQSGKTYFNSDYYADITCFGNRLFVTLYGSDYHDMIIDAQTGSVEFLQDKTELFEVNDEPYGLWMRNGYSFVKNLNTQETVLRMFVASAG